MDAEGTGPKATPESGGIPPNHALRTGLLLLLAAAALIFIFRGKLRFDWSAFFEQVRRIDPVPLVVGTVLILSSTWLRSVRWARFLANVRPVPPFSLVGTQFIGFAAVSLFGRIADLTRPYLVAQRTGLSLASQVAVYTVERIFDLAAAAILFSLALAMTPRSAPHHEILSRMGLLSLAGTVFLALFAVSIRSRGLQIAAFVERGAGRLSASLGERLSEKILGFRDGLNTLSSFRDVLYMLAVSLVMWTLIGESYVQTCHAFTTTPELATLTFSRTMQLMAASMGGSLLQLPIVGWFTQIAVTAAAMHTLYGAPIEAATACGGLLLCVTTLSFIPAGLIFSRIDRTSLGSAARQSAASRPLAEGRRSAAIGSEPRTPR